MKTYATPSDWKRSCPAVSQICIVTNLSSTITCDMNDEKFKKMVRKPWNNMVRTSNCVKFSNLFCQEIGPDGGLVLR